MIRLQHMIEEDRRALADFISCTSCCEDCRAKPYCDEFAATEQAEWEYLVGEYECASDESA